MGSTLTDDEVRQKCQAMELPELAAQINSLEGFAWRLNHDAADGRISDQGIDSSIDEIHKTVMIIASVFAEKDGLDINDREKVGMRVRQELANYEKLLDDRWTAISIQGATFRYVPPEKNPESDILETLAVYDTGFVGGFDQAVFFRVHDSRMMSAIYKRDIANYKVVDTKSMYLTESRFTRTDFKKIRKTTGRIQLMRSISPIGAVFIYSGPRGDDCFETFYGFYRSGSERDAFHDKVVIARSQTQPLVAKFATCDLKYIRIEGEAIFIKREGNRTRIPRLEV